MWEDLVVMVSCGVGGGGELGGEVSGRKGSGVN